LPNIRKLNGESKDFVQKQLSRAKALNAQKNDNVEAYG